MVSRAYDYHNEEPAFGRYNSRGHSYPLSHDRDLSSSHGPYGGSRNQLPHEPRACRQSPEQESSSSHPRRRIPVACGRCRKRKIRCSGDPGNGGPCSNCKSAGNDQCAFLRVSSTEAQMKSDQSDFNYEPPPPPPRSSCRMGPYGPAYGPQPILTTTEGFPYRHNSIPSYPFQGKAYYGIPSYGDFPDETIDYSLQGAAYSLLSSESLGMPSNYSTSSNPRGWTPAPQLPKNNAPLYLEQEAAYNHPQPLYSNNGLVLRPTISPESKAMSMNGMASSLPQTMNPPINSTERVLPYPAHRPYLRSSDGTLPGPQHMRSLDSLHSYNSLMSANMINNTKAINNGSVTENASLSSSYLPLTHHSSQEQLSSQHIDYNSSSLVTNQQQNDIYASSQSQHGLYNQHNGSSDDLRGGSYGLVSHSSKRPSQSSQSDGTLSSSSPASLTNGHQYVPFQHQYHPAPPMEMPGPLPGHRGSVTSIQAGA